MMGDILFGSFFPIQPLETIGQMLDGAGDNAAFQHIGIIPDSILKDKADKPHDVFVINGHSAIHIGLT